MIISGLLVNVLPEKRREVQDMINSLKGAEISSILSDNKLVVLVQSGSVEEKKLTSQMIEKVDGVVSVNLAYDHHERDESNERGCES